MLTKTEFRQGINAYLQGGLGNQLFIYAAALEQSKRLDCQLFIDTSFYSTQLINPSPNVTARTFELGNLIMKSVVIDSESPWLNFPPLNRRNRMFIRLMHPPVTVHEEKSLSYDSNINLVRPGTTLVGYFQNPLYSHNASPDILGQLNAYLVSRKKSLVSERARVNIHIRRGDYLDPIRANTQQLADLNYFTKAIHTATQKFGGFEGVVFTDSPELVSELLGSHENLILSDSSDLAPLDLLCEMASGEGIIMSNSSLSWWAARLMQYKSPEALVIAPRPWHGGGKADEMYMNSWTVLDQ